MAVWGPGRTCAALGFFVVLVLVEALVVSIFDPDLDTLGATLALQAALAVTMVVVAFGAAAPGAGLAAAPALGLRRPSRPVVGVSALAYLVYVACAVVIALLVQPEQEDITRELGFGESVVGSISAGILIVVAAPITEEIFFRGFIFAGLRRAMPFLAAAAISAGVFGLLHFSGSDSWGVVLQLTVFGVVLAWLYERTGSIWPTIAVHGVNNAIAFSILAS